MATGQWWDTLNDDDDDNLLDDGDNDDDGNDEDDEDDDNDDDDGDDLWVLLDRIFLPIWLPIFSVFSFDNQTFLCSNFV